MSDALCGPSNPLQQFQKQTSLDRTLQQDRLATRRPPSQGFRSRDPLAGRLDADFEAFQAGLPLADLPAFHQAPNPNAFAASSQSPSWASDFQRMHISPPPAIHQQQQYVPIAGPSSANWATGFREHIAQSAPRAQTSTHSPQTFQHMARHGMSTFQHNYLQPGFAPNVLSKGKEPAVEEFDEAAFERAFNQASLDMVSDMDTREQVAKEEQQLAYEAGASTANYPGDLESYTDRQDSLHMSQDTEATALEDANRAGEFERLENEPIIEPDVNMLDKDEEIVSNSQTDDDDALAATAKELLEKIQHNQTDKFKNSQFLGLMRKLRDREMRVEGDQMVQTVRPAHDSTYGSATPSPVHLSSSTLTPDPSAPLALSNGENNDFDHWESPYR